MTPPLEQSLNADWMADPKSVDLSAFAPYSRTLQVFVSALLLAGDEGPTLPASWAAAKEIRDERIRGPKHIFVNPARGSNY